MAEDRLDELLKVAVDNQASIKACSDDILRQEGKEWKCVKVWEMALLDAIQNHHLSNSPRAAEHIAALLHVASDVIGSAHFRAHPPQGTTHLKPMSPAQAALWAHEFGKSLVRMVPAAYDSAIIRENDGLVMPRGPCVAAASPETAAPRQRCTRHEARPESGAAARQVATIGRLPGIWRQWGLPFVTDELLAHV